ncbi:hypothetical protein AcW1_009669 [Taiwanofungus camphoratus]|nr:hypothetical protein AcW1_009669 [Antrodia cinnamomea]
MKGVLPTRGACPPDCIDIAVVEAYAAGMGDGPDIAAPRLDWMADFKSSWNRETIHILSKDFLREVRAGDHRPLEYDPVEMKLKKMVASCRSKLQQVRMDFLAIHGQQAVKLQQKKMDSKIQARRNTRQSGTYNRRCNIVDAHQTTDSSIWGHIGTILNILDVGGMSSDQTDPESVGVSIHNKKLRRVPLEWQNAELTTLWKWVDSYGDLLLSQGLLQGNRPYPRSVDPAGLPSRRQPMFHLPVNFYNAEWLKARSKNQRFKLHLGSPVAIPTLSEHKVSE